MHLNIYTVFGHHSICCFSKVVMTIHIYLSAFLLRKYVHNIKKHNIFWTKLLWKAQKEDNAAEDLRFCSTEKYIFSVKLTFFSLLLQIIPQLFNFLSGFKRRPHGKFSNVTLIAVRNQTGCHTRGQTGTMQARVRLSPGNWLWSSPGSESEKHQNVIQRRSWEASRIRKSRKMKHYREGILRTD